MRAERPVESVVGALAQLTQGVIGLALLLVAHQVQLAVTTSALAVSAYALGMAVGRPVQGRALDRLRPAPVLASCGLAHGLAYVALAVAAHHHWAGGYVGFALLAGLTLPPIATQMRAAWPSRAPGDAAARVFAAITAVQTVSVLLAPVLFTAVDAIASPTVAMLAVAGIAAVCTVLFGVACREPAAARRPGSVRLRRYASLLAMTALLGVAGGTLEVYAPAVAIAAGHPGWAGILVAVSTIGTLAGAAVAVRRPLPVRAALAVQLLGAAVLLVPASLVLAGAGLLVLGLGFTPAVAGLSAAIARRSGGTALSFGWQSTALGLGVAAGSALAGSFVAGAAHLSALPAVIAAVSCLALTPLVRTDAGTADGPVTGAVSAAARR